MSEKKENIKYGLKVGFTVVFAIILLGYCLSHDKNAYNRLDKILENTR